MPLGEKFLQKKQREKPLSAIKSSISLSNVRDGLLPLLNTLNVIKPSQEVIEIDFDWHNIKDDICPITIKVKGASRPKMTKE
jgi:hypothetical protein